MQTRHDDKAPALVFDCKVTRAEAVARVEELAEAFPMEIRTAEIVNLEEESL